MLKLVPKKILRGVAVWWTSILSEGYECSLAIRDAETGYLKTDAGLSMADFQVSHIGTAKQLLHKDFELRCWKL